MSSFDKVFINNRKGQKISVIVELINGQKGLAFVMHGLGGFKEQATIQTIADAFKENRYSVIRFDTTNTIGESDGKYEDATVTNYYEDLDDIIACAKTQKWYTEPFCLAGHSLGALCVALFAEKYPKIVKGLAPISTVVSGQLSRDIMPKDELKKWKKTGYQERMSSSKIGVELNLKWSHMADRLKYDLLKKASKLTMPVLMIVGENDDKTPTEQQKMLFDKLAGKKQLHIIEGAKHTFRQEQHLKELKQIFSKWIKGF